MKKLFMIIIFMMLSSIGFPKEGFVPSQNKNIFLIKGSTSGATIFLVNLPSRGKVLMTQAQVIDELGQNTTLNYGTKFGWFFREESRDPDAFEFLLKQEIICKDNGLDVAMLKAPSELIEKCQCGGLEVVHYKDGQASLIGYPIIGRRTYPRTGKFWTRIGELFGSVEKMESTGKVWKESNQILSDIDALSGNSGGPILNEEGKVIGIIHKMKTWYGIGCRYLNPHAEITPMDEVLMQMEEK